MSDHWLGLDIGGANIKIADGDSYARNWPFALWRTPEELADKLRDVLADAPRSCASLAVTMTGELADCFESKAKGVTSILDSLRQAAPNQEVRIFTVNAGWLSIDEAIARPLAVAASNWMATAAFCQRYMEGCHGWLLDVGSTTVDLVPFVDGIARPLGRTDVDRLLHGELIYLGMQRTPLSALVDELPYRGRMCPVAAELFATTADVFVLGNVLPEDPCDHETPDGRSLAREDCRRRLGRMLCVDLDAFNDADADLAAGWTMDRFSDRVRAAFDRSSARLQSPRRIVIAGHAGSFADRLVDGFADDVVALPTLVGHSNARCAPAFALAQLAGEINLV